MNAPLTSSSIATLPRSATWEEWQRGRAARRTLAMRLTGGKTLRREAGNPRKDAFLRSMNGGQRGQPFTTL